uniref:Uncharacterized protein n=1 Tax=Octopus bimaculoides TaxID=37653 RepID=A0A0L8FZH6_OCTBM
MLQQRCFAHVYERRHYQLKQYKYNNKRMEIKPWDSCIKSIFEIKIYKWIYVYVYGKICLMKIKSILKTIKHNKDKL